jgi:hypothetical protein
VASDASCLVSHVTRYTEEVFTMMIASAFLYEAGTKLKHIYEDTTYIVHNPVWVLTANLRQPTFSL